MSRIAHEVSRRMTPEYAKERAREMARERMERARDRAVESSWLAPAIGAGIGALVAKALQSRAQERGWDDRRAGWEHEGRRHAARYGRDMGYPPYAEYEYGADSRARDEATHAGADGEQGASGMRERASQGAAQVSEKVSGMAEGARERAGEMAGEMKDRLREATSSMRERLPDRERIRSSAREDTGLWALGAAALGALFGFALPETDRERELLEPARRKARALGQEVRDRALEKGAEAMEKATDEVRSAGGEQRAQQGHDETSGIVTPPGSPAPLH